MYLLVDRCRAYRSEQWTLLCWCGTIANTCTVRGPHLDSGVLRHTGCVYFYDTDTTHYVLCVWKCQWVDWANSSDHSELCGKVWKQGLCTSVGMRLMYGECQSRSPLGTRCNSGICTLGLARAISSCLSYSCRVIWVWSGVSLIPRLGHQVYTSEDWGDKGVCYILCE